MSFSEKLNEYLNEYSISSAQLTVAAGLSKSTISRFKSGKQEPPSDSDTLQKLAKGLSALTNLSSEEIQKTLKAELKSQPEGFETIAKNLNRLISTLEINANDLSRYLNYDASYLSRIRSAQRRPSSIPEFCEGVASFTANHYGQSTGTLAILLGCNEEDIKSQTALKSELLKWLCSSSPRAEQSVRHFLDEVDKFDLNEYIRTIHYEQMKVPSIPLKIPGSKAYYKLSGFMKAELDWTRSTVLSPSAESVIMYSDMPMEEMAKDKDFTKKVIVGMAMMLKKGLHLNVIHNIDRSFNEMMLGLNGWIPLYMTGQVSPYYFKGKRDPVFNNFLRVSGACALSGEAVSGSHENGRYYLTRNKGEIAYYRQRGEDMLTKAEPLMEIYRKESQEAFSLFLKNNYYDKRHSYRSILSAPPLHTMTEELLLKILDSNNIEDNEREIILNHYHSECDSFESILRDTAINDELLMPNEEELIAYPIAIPLADIFIEKEICYTFDTICEHIELTKSYADSHKNYICTIAKGQPFRNIQIRIAENEYAIISKNTSPAIHFVVRHQKLRRAIEQMILPPESV